MQSLTEKYRPRVIADFVGLEKPKRLCARLAAEPFSSAYLFLGSSGTGKTTIALALAASIPAEVHHIPSQECNVETLERVRRACDYFPKPGCKMHLILIDEMDRMTPSAQLKILSYTDATNFPPHTIIIGTANSIEGLEDRTLSRFPAVEFSSYGIAKDTAALLERVWRTERGLSDSDTLEGAPNFARIVKESKQQCPRITQQVAAGIAFSITISKGYSMKKELEYSVIVNVLAHDVKDAANKACELFNQGETPDYVISTRNLSPLINKAAKQSAKKTANPSDLEDALCHAIDSVMLLHGIEFRTADTSIAFDLASDVR